MTTAELSKETGVSVRTILRYAKDLKGLPVGGRQGYIFSKKAVDQLPILIREQASKRKPTRVPNAT